MDALLWFAGAAPARVPATAFIGLRHLRSRLVHLAQESTMSRSRIASTVAATFFLVGICTTAVVRAVPLDLAPLIPGQDAVTARPDTAGPLLRRTPWASIVEWAVGVQSNPRQPRVYSSKDEGITLPTVVSEAKPVYTSAALAAKIAGDVLMAVVVKSDGTVGDVKVTKSLDTVYGLDQAAVDSARRWRFKPGTREGKPVDVQVDLQMRFTYR